MKLSTAIKEGLKDYLLSLAKAVTVGVIFGLILMVYPTDNVYLQAVIVVLVYTLVFNFGRIKNIVRNKYIRN